MSKATLTDTQKAKKKKGICTTLFCTKKIRIRNGKPTGNKCVGCQHKVYIKNHPLEYTFGVHRRNAKRRKKYHDLTFPQFKKFVGNTDYMRKKGTSAKSFQIDRDKECVPGCPPFCKDHGYTYKNIKAITLRENVYKYAKHKRDYSEVPF